MNVLLVEDSSFDVRVFQRALKKAEIDLPLTIARNGVEALSVLRGDDGEALQRPHIVFLDLNMPEMDGHEFLQELRGDPDHSDTVVFVLTTSDAPDDRKRAYSRHVAGYFLKAIEARDAEDLMALIKRYAERVKLPVL